MMDLKEGRVHALLDDTKPLATIAWHATERCGSVACILRKFMKSEAMRSCGGCCEISLLKM